MPVIGRPAVDPHAAGQQPVAEVAIGLAIGAEHRLGPARHPIAGEGAGHVAELLAGFAVEQAGVGADLPAAVGGVAAQGGVETIAHGWGRVLLAGRSGGVAAGGHGRGAVLEVGTLDPALQTPADTLALRLVDQGRREGRPGGAGVGPDQAGAALFLIAREAHRQLLVAQLRGPTQGAAEAAIIEFRIGRTASGAQRDPAVAALARRGQEEVANDTGGGGSDQAAFAAIDLVFAAARGAGAFGQLDGSGQRAGAIGAGARAAHDLGLLDRDGRQPGPQHPAAERIVLRHAVEQDQGAAGPRAGDRADADPLGGGVGGLAGGAPEKLDARGRGQRLVQARRGRDGLAVDGDDRERLVGRRRRQAGGFNHDGVNERRKVQRHVRQLSPE